MPALEIGGRSQLDYVTWGAALMKRYGLDRSPGFHLVGWAHDDWCPFSHGTPAPTARCTCRPDATIYVDAGSPAERQIEVVRDGIELDVVSRHPAVH